VPDLGSVLHALAKSEKGDLYTLLTEQSAWVSVLDLGSMLFAHAKSKKGTSKFFLWSSRYSPPILYAFAKLRIQTGSSFYATPLARGARLLSAMLAHHLTDLLST
jgi:hypothetical protein